MAKTRRSSNAEDMSPTQRLLFAAEKNDLEMCKKIFRDQMNNDVRLVNEIDIEDIKGQNALLIAARNGNFEVLSWLVTLGVDLEVKSRSGATAFLLSSDSGSKDCLMVLKIAGANINTDSFDGDFPLKVACKAGHLEVVNYLLQIDCDPNQVDSVLGESPLIVASYYNKFEIVQSLLSTTKTDLNICDKLGWNALSIAKAKGFSKIANLLVSHGAFDTGPAKFPIDSIFMDEKLANEIQDVDEMKIQTMYKMVDECTVVTQGKEIQKKVLYLTNKQAVMFDEEAMERAVLALDIGEPKFVIKLMPSHGVQSQMHKAHPEQVGQEHLQYKKSEYVSSEIDHGDERIVETQLILFMKTCILPLAMQTRALILVSGANDCILSSALARVAVAEQSRLGKDCPFTVIATVSEDEVHAKAVSPNPEDLTSIASQLARQSPAWQKRIVFMNDFYSNKMLLADIPLQQCDLTEAAARYIIFEGYEEGPSGGLSGSCNRGPQKSFESVFLQYMTRKLPSIAIQCMQPGQGLPFLVDLTSRNIPVLLLDSTERCFTSMKYDDRSGPMTKLAREADTFPSISMEQAQKIQVADGTLTNEAKTLLLELGLEIEEKKLETLGNHGVIDSLDTSRLAFFHRVLTLDSENGISAMGSVPLYERIKEMEKLERTSKDMKKNIVSPELAQKVVDFMHTRLSALEEMCKLQRVENFVQRCPKTMKKYLCNALEEKRRLTNIVDKINMSGGSRTDAELDQSEWLAQYDILTSPNTFSGSIFDLDEVKRILGSVAKIDRLPNSNSLEALRTIQDAWDHVEMYNHDAQTYKHISKVVYILMLLVGVITTFFAIVDARKVFAYNYDSSLPIIVLSVVGTLTATYVSYINPAQKWQQLRMAALSIESSIWTFRTRAGPYRTTGEGFDQSAEMLLSDILKDIKSKVLEGADIKSTAFYSRFKTQNKHGQHPSKNSNLGALDNFASDEKYKVNSKSQATLLQEANKSNSKVVPNETSSYNLSNVEDGLHKASSKISTFSAKISLFDIVARLRRDTNDGDYFSSDSHYEPLQPDSYIRFRVIPAMNFYKRRIPRCNNTRNLSQLLLVTGTLGTAGLAIGQLSYWASFVAIINSSITAYLEFSGTNSKISRYSFTVHALQELIYWWQTLPQIDKSVVANIDRLVLTCEELLQREQQAWRSTSQTVRMLQKQSQDQSSDKR